MSLEIGMDHPEWWDAVLDDIRRSGKVGEALEAHGLIYAQVDYINNQFPHRKEEWSQAVYEGKYADFIAAFPEIKAQVLMGADAVTAAQNCGLSRRRWYHVLDHNPAAKEYFQALRKELPRPSKERHAVNWLIAALRSETEETGDAIALVALGALREIVEAANQPDVEVGDVRAVANMAAGRVLAHREDMPASVRWTLGLDEEE